MRVSLALLWDGRLQDALLTCWQIPAAPGPLFHLARSLLFYINVNRMLVQAQSWCNIHCPFRLHNLYPAWWSITERESSQQVVCFSQTDGFLYWVWIMIHNSLSHTGTSSRQIIEYFSISRAPYLLRWTKAENTHRFLKCLTSVWQTRKR